MERCEYEVSITVYNAVTDDYDEVSFDMVGPEWRCHQDADLIALATEYAEHWDLIPDGYAIADDIDRAPVAVDHSPGCGSRS